MPDLRTVEPSSRQASGQTLTSIGSIEYPASTSTLRRQDARDLFDDFGIDRPSGWLSDDEDTGPTAIDGHKSISKVVKVCHSCGAPVTSRKFCPSCGHSTCVKCTSEVPGHHAESEDGGIHNIVRHIGTAVHETPNPRETQPYRGQYVVQGHQDIPPSPPKAPQDFGSAVAVRNNPFVLADQRAKGAVAKPKLTPTPARPRKATRLSDCLPSQRAVSGHGSVLTSGLHSPHGARQALHDEREAAVSEFRTLEACPDPETEPHCKSMNSLEKKIDKLYHHAEDLQNTKHIMEHLATGTSANHEHRGSEHKSPGTAASSLDPPISPPGLRAPHNISDDPAVPVRRGEESHTIGKDPLDRVKGWPRPHTLSLDLPVADVPVPEARLSKTPAWLLNLESSPGNAWESLNQVETTQQAPKPPRRPVTSPPISSGMATPQRTSQQQLGPTAPSSDGKSHDFPWRHKPLRRIGNMSNIPGHAEKQNSPEPEFRRRRLRKVTRPKTRTSDSSQAGTRKNGPQGCVNCCPEIAPEADGEEGPHSFHAVTPIPGEGQGFARPNDPDELFLPYRHKAFEKRPLTVAEVEQALASDSSIGKFSPPAAQRVETDDDILSPVPIMLPNHTCSWRTRYMNLTAEVRQLKAEKVLREKALEQADASPDSSEAAAGGDVADEELGIEGLTIVVHLKGRDDLVVNTDLRGVS